jgi:hypothetical protein
MPFFQPAGYCFLKMLLAETHNNKKPGEILFRWVFSFEVVSHPPANYGVRREASATPLWHAESRAFKLSFTA